MPEITVRSEKEEQPSRARVPRVWTTSRKLIGNLVPFMIASPIAAIGVWKLKQDWPFLGFALLWFAGTVLVLWLAVNQFGLFQNEAIKRTMWRRMEASLGPKGIPPDPIFVGFARPSFHSLIDPHEDVGFLLLFHDHAEFFGDGDRVMLPKSCLVRVAYRMNPHSWAILGGWVSLEGVLDGKPVRMLLEPRDKRTLRQNRRLRSQLKRQLEEWLGLGSDHA